MIRYKSILGLGLIALISLCTSLIAIPIIMGSVGVDGVYTYGIYLTIISIMSFLDFGLSTKIIGITESTGVINKNKLISGLSTIIEITGFALLLIILLIIFLNTKFSNECIIYGLIVLGGYLRNYEQMLRAVSITSKKLLESELINSIANIIKWVAIFSISKLIKFDQVDLILILVIVQLLNVISLKKLIEIKSNWNISRCKYSIDYIKNNNKSLKELTKYQIVKIIQTQLDKVLYLIFLNKIDYTIILGLQNILSSLNAGIIFFVNSNYEKIKKLILENSYNSYLNKLNITLLIISILITCILFLYKNDAILLYYRSEEIITILNDKILIIFGFLALFSSLSTLEIRAISIANFFEKITKFQTKLTIIFLLTLFFSFQILELTNILILNSVYFALTYFIIFKQRFYWIK